MLLMPISRFCLVLAYFTFSFAPLPAADLSKIGRRLVKEPTYQSKPKYCLLVFGPEATTRIWLVLDGETLYVDRNGSGDLTVDGCQCEKLKDADSKLQQTCLSARNVTVPRGKVTIEFNQIIYDKIRKNHPVSVGLAKIERPGDLQRAGSFSHESLQFADRPQDAPILHFDGPRQMQLAYVDPPGARQEPVLTRGAKSCELYATMGTPGLGKGSFVAHAHDGLPADIHPVVDIEFPAKKSGTGSMRKTYPLTKRC